MRKYNFSGIGSAPTGAVAPIYKTKEQAEEEKNKGGVLGGLGYLGEKAAASFMQSVEGIWDYTAGGLAKLFGADDWAEEQFRNDWFGDWYSHPDEWYNPGEGWKVAGDVAGGIGTSLPSLAAVGIGAAVAYFSGGTLSPVAVGLISAGTAGLGAAGTSTKQAYQETGKLGGAEFGYGALSGTVEGTTEGITNALTLGTGAVVKNIGKAFGKEMTETVAKQSVLKGLFGAFAGEAFEEGLSEWVNPYLAQMTYDPNAEEATAQEIAYAAFVGGLSGMVMQGGNVAIDSGSSFARGTSIANRGLEGEVLNLSAQIAAFQDANNTENEAYRTVAETYKKLSESLAQTGGVAETAAQRKMLGDLSRANVAAVFSPMITRSAAQIYANADVIAARLTEYGYKDASGKPMTFTAEQIREGITPGDKKSFETALKTNSVLRTLAVASTTGQLTMDTRAFRDATLAGRNLASRADLWNFAENATADEVRAVSAALGIENWETLTEDEFAEKIATFLREGGAERYAAERAAEERIFADTGAAMLLPPTIALEDGQSRKFTDGERELAIARRGEEYRIYDMATRTGTRAMSRAEVNKALADEREKRQSILSEAKESERRRAEIKRKREETDAWARENVKKYAELSAQSKTVVRKVIAAARASGLSETDVQMYATVSAHAGLDIVFSKRLCKVEGGYADAFWDPGKNRIVVNPEAKRSAEKILLHELDHAVRSGIRKDGGTQVFAEAIFGIDTEAAQKITARYKNVKSEVSQAELIWDEANAYFAETFFANKNVLASLTEKVPSLRERILAFFEGAKSDYAGAPSLEGAAKRYYTTYKKMFDEFAERNADRNAEEGAGGSAKYRITDDSLIKKYPRLNLNEDFSDKDGVPAIRLEDGSVLTFTEPHVSFIQASGIDAEDIESGGWIANGVYEPSERSDTLRYKERMLAKKRMEEKRAAKKAEGGVRYALPDDVEEALFDDEFYEQFAGESKEKITETAAELENIINSEAFKDMDYDTQFDTRAKLKAVNAGYTTLYDYYVGRRKASIIEDYERYLKTGRENSVSRKLKEKQAAKAKQEKISAEKSEATPHKNAQFAIIQQTNPMYDEFHTGIRSPADIKTFAEVVDDADSFTWGDFTREDAKAALEAGKIRIYSSYAIKNGVFVSTSYKQALDYAGDDAKSVHSRTVALDSVAWINGDEGQYARVTQKKSDGRRYALPMDDEALDKVLDDMRENGVVFDPEGIIMKGAPVIPDSPRAKIHTRARAYMVFEKLADNNLLSNKSRKEFLDVIYKAMNSFETATEKQSFAHEAAEFFVARLLTEAKTENPNVRPAHRRLSWLNIGVGKLSFSPSDIAEMRAVLDESEFRKIFGRWGRKTSGTPSYMLDMFINEVSTTIPGMSYIGRMHPVEALLELDKMYEEARKTITVDKYISAYWDSTDDDILAMVKSAEDAIINGFDAQDKAIIEEKLENTRELAESYKEQFDTLRGTIRYRGYIASRVEKLNDMKKGVFHNSSIYKEDTFDKILGKLTSIEWRKNLSVTRVREVMKDIANWYTKENALLGYVDKNNVGYYDESIAEKMQALANGDGAISAAELAELDQVLGYLTKFIETYNKVYINGKWVDAKPVAQRYVNILHDGGKLKEGFFREWWRKYLVTYGDFASVVRYFDRYRPDGFFTETLERLRAAAIEADVQIHRIMKPYEAFMQKNKNYLRKAEGETVEFMGVTMPKMTAISLYMTMGREQAQKGFAVGGFQFETANGETVRVEGMAMNTELTEEAILSVVTARRKELYGLLSDADKDYIQILEHGYNAETRALKAARDMERYGFTNVMNDYYYPIRRANTANSVDSSLSAELDRVSSAGFNKDTVKGAAGELFIQNADTLYRNHVRAVCQYATLSPAIEAYNKLFNMDISGNPNHPISVKTESKNVWKNAHGQFRLLIGDMQGIPRERGEAMEFLGMLRGGYAKFQLGANPKTVATQISSLLASTSVLDADSVAKAFGVSGKDVDKYCALAELRNADNTAAMAQGVLNTGKRVKYGIDKVSDAMMKPIGWMDRQVITRLFAACQVQVAKNNGPKLNTEENRVAAGELLTRVILETQQNSFATERSAAMRSGNEIMRTLTMFSADAMKVTGRVIDAFGEISALRERIKNAEGEAKAELKAQLKRANKRMGKSVGAMLAVAAYSAGIAQLFRWLYDKEKDEDESTAEIMIADFAGNMVGGLPIIKEFTRRFTDGFGVENYSLAMLNDLLDSTVRVVNFAGNVIKGNADGQNAAAELRNLAYTAGQFTGIPARNIYNMLYGLTKRFSPQTAYKVDEWFYAKNYENDLARYVREGDDRMTNMLLSLAVNEKTGSALSATAHTELHRLITAGYKILPREIGKTITVDGNEYEMSEDEREMVRAAYADVTDKLDTLFRNRAYTLLSDEEKEEAIRYLYNTAYSEAITDVYGIDRGNAPVIADVVGYDVATLAYMRTKGIEADKGKDGKSLPGTKKKKTVAAINTLNISTEKKLFLICAKGYSLADGDVRGLTAQAAKKKLLAYILALPGKTKDEKARLAEMCGFAVKNGKISLKNTA